ncbi:Fatty acid oxidation complex subunit alpha [Phocoenobacter uteri]|uniref:enoyl-CoA hydratase n=1 Tax=Phocoenobacter uteri TaxID=146806 RepID=A0A379CAU3_9PAST|nr:3-hydroxyacyl-CoA dehydrogenase NAD-binding domain-containing protein [Phocoenobacter uteri]MDG6881236.1 fatty-acid oxidation protein subunit alpha [Phocoenobacter uteri]SUB59258.1 Fatty acid oxidation complex subunit alpha [Phocoenobacter uteri]
MQSQLKNLSLLKLEMQPSNIALLSIDVPDNAVNWLPEHFFRELNDVLEYLKTDLPSGLVITSAKKQCFIQGFDLDCFQNKTADELKQYSAFAQQVLTSLANLTIPTLSAINGNCFGVGLEIALACDYRFVSDKQSLNLALPQVLSGILPFAGGTQRLAQCIGLRNATPLLLSGRKISHNEALKLGLVDKIVPVPRLLALSYQWIKQRQNNVPPLKKNPLSLTIKKLENSHYLRHKYLERAETKIWLKEFGHYPAIKKIIDVLKETDFDIALQQEQNAFVELFQTEESQVLIKLKRTQRAMRLQYRHISNKVQDVKHVSILGSGYMGAGIAYLTANAQIPVRIKDIQPIEIQKALHTCYALMRDAVANKEMAYGEMIQRMNLISGGERLVSMQQTDFIMEAVYENLALKQQILQESERFYSEKAIFATNTSTCHIQDIASVARHPERVIGFHYLSPLTKRKIVEIIPHKTTSDQVIATAVHFAIQQGRIPMLVSDTEGFFVNRVLIPYLLEAIECVVDGEAIEFIDRSLQEFGFQIGPLSMIDDMGLDMIVKSNFAMVSELGERFRLPKNISLLVQNERKGRKNKRGFYLYDSNGERSQEDKSIYHVMEVIPRNDLESEEIVRRCLLRMINEACWCLQDNVISSTDEGDVASVFAMAFPEFRGGIYAYIDKIGAKEIVKQLRKHTELYGSRFEPCDWLLERA